MARDDLAMGAGHQRQSRRAAKPPDGLRTRLAELSPVLSSGSASCSTATTSA